MHPHESTIQEQYNQLAHIYDWRWQRYITNTLSFFKAWAEIPPAAAILDVACGTGELERLLLNDNPDQTIVGVDLSEQMLSQARQKLSGYSNVSFQQAAASQLPFSDQSFDVVVSANAFHYFPGPEMALKEMKRVLKPGGTVVMLDWCKDFLLCQVYDWVLKRLDPAYQQCYTEAELQGLLKAAGFRIDRTQRIRLDVVWGLMAVSAVS
jgi:ubiquinone/menaquinone biosynthesis C-methylase UbiE